jgi:hypothetical protein
MLLRKHLLAGGVLVPLFAVALGLIGVAWQIVSYGKAEGSVHAVAVNTQVIVITCRSQDYLSAVGLPADGPATVDLAAGTVRAVDMTRTVDQFGNAAAR